MEQPKNSTYGRKLLQLIFVLLRDARCNVLWGMAKRSTLRDSGLASQVTNIFVRCNYFILYFPIRDGSDFSRLRELENSLANSVSYLLFGMISCTELDS